MNRHLKFFGVRFAEGRSRIAPLLEHLSTIDTDEHWDAWIATLRYSTALVRLELDIVVTGYGNLVWRHSPHAQSCDLAWTATSQGGVSKSGPNRDT